MSTNIPRSAAPCSQKPFVIEENSDSTDVKEYGIGVDCHKKFIMVCVRTRQGTQFITTTTSFDTDWDSLARAKAWCLEILSRKSSPAINPDIPFHYCIESTASYHYPVLLSWGGTPSVINPTIAGATKRKTDFLDAKLLALHDQTGIWRESFIVPKEVMDLRVMISKRDRCVREATAAGNRINNIILRFGVTIGNSGSVTKNLDIRKVIEGLISDEPVTAKGICPLGIPEQARCILRQEYDIYDRMTSEADSWKEKIIEKARSIMWETSDSVLPGDEMIRILTTAPQIGEMTAITWLSQIITPRRFPNEKAVAAFCGLDPSLRVSAGHVTGTKRRGGCKQLHRILCYAADRLIRHHTEMFGLWGFNLYNQTGKWKKASNAVGRKLAIALYYMMMTGQEFSYEGYRLCDYSVQLDIPIQELPSLNHDFKRYIRLLEEKNIHTTSELVRAYTTCSLGSVHGLGKKFFVTLRDFMNNQKAYRQLYEQMYTAT